LEHGLFFDGNTKKIAWVIQTGEVIIEESRIHAEIYLDKISNQQSKFVALHVAIFWGIGTFIFKNKDIVKISIDDSEIMEYLISNKKNSDEFIERRRFFIQQLIDQRKLDIKLKLIDSNQNLASKNIL
jgi:hypothetical protein